MAENIVERKLRAILCADVKGYSRMMGDDELGTYQTLTANLETIRSIISEHKGRVFSSPGDAVMAEFSSVVDAVLCAVKMQENIEAVNTPLPIDQKMQFRIGVNLGDVIHDGKQVFGDGVNIAARIETLAEPGGVSITRNVYDQVRNKLKFGYEYQGEHRVKNIAEPIRVYKVLTSPEHEGQLIGEHKPPKRLSKQSYILILVVLALIVVAAIWQIYPRTPEIEPSSVERMALPLPDKPSIAVLAFDNLSGDPEQEYFSDGLTDDLITDLSKISNLFVIARNSTFAYKGKPIKIRQVAEELGVRYVLEGSVRKATDRIRINAQLIDASTGGHLWAERYDGNIGDVFSLQDKITRKIVDALAVKLTQNEEDKITQKDTLKVQAYEAFLKGWAHYVRHTPDDFAMAVKYFEEAIELDSNYGRAYAALAATYWEIYYRFWHESINVQWYETRVFVEKYTQVAMKKKPTSLAYSVSSRMLIAHNKHDEAIAETERALALDPNDATSYISMAYNLIYVGKPNEAIYYIKKAMRMDPEYPPYYLFIQGLTHFGMDQFEEAAPLFKRALELNPENYIVLIPLAATYAHLNYKKEAKSAIKRLNALMPIVTLLMIEDCPLWKYKNFVDRNRLMTGLEVAGLAKTSYDLIE